jgi:hypothetical protein
MFQIQQTKSMRVSKRSRPVQVKYDVIIPCSVKHAKELDTKNGNTLWADAIMKEIDSLLRLGCFDF